MLELLNDLASALNRQQYHLSSPSGLIKTKTYETRLEAEMAMNRYCGRHNIKVECKEEDCNNLVYRDENGNEFVINKN